MNLIIIGGGALIVILLIVGIVVSVTSERSLVEDRLKNYLEEEKPEANKEAEGSAITDWVNRRVATSSMGDRISRELARADLKFKVAEYFALIFIATIAVAVIAYLIQPSPISAVIGAVVGFFTPRFYVKRQQVQRLNKFNDQLSDMLNLMVNGLRSIPRRTGRCGRYR